MPIWGRTASALLALVVLCSPPALATRRVMSTGKPAAWNPAAACDLIVVGEIARAANVDLRSSDRVSDLRPAHVLCADAVLGDTVRVFWRSPGVMDENGRISIWFVEGVPPLPDIDAFADKPAVWLLRRRPDGLAELYHRPVLLAPDRAPAIRAFLDSLQAPVDDPAAAQKARAVTLYLEGYLDGLTDAR